MIAWQGYGTAYTMEFTDIGVRDGFVAWLKSKGFDVLSAEHGPDGWDVLFRDIADREHRARSGDTVMIDLQGVVSIDPYWRRDR